MQPQQKNLERAPAQEIENDFDLPEKGKIEASGEARSAKQAQARVQAQVVADDEGVGEPGIDSTRAPIHQEIENILEQDLEEIYFSMDGQTQEIFKNKGEKTTQGIIKLIQDAKATFKKIFKLVISWLKIIPGVNRFFLEQEAKIKADKILKNSNF